MERPSLNPDTDLHSHWLATEGISMIRTDSLRKSESSRARSASYVVICPLKSGYGFDCVHVFRPRRVARASSTILWPCVVSLTRVNFPWLGSGMVSTNPSRSSARHVLLVLDWPSENCSLSSCILAVPDGCRARKTRKTSECTGSRLPAPLLPSRRNASRVSSSTRRSSTASWESRRMSSANTTSTTDSREAERKPAAATHEASRGSRSG